MRQKRRSTQDKFLSHFVYRSSPTFPPLRRSLRRSFSRRDSVATGEKKANFLSPPLSAAKRLVRTKKKDGGGSKPRANIRTSVVGFRAERLPRGGVCGRKGKKYHTQRGKGKGNPLPAARPEPKRPKEKKKRILRLVWLSPPKRERERKRRRFKLQTNGTPLSASTLLLLCGPENRNPRTGGLIIPHQQQRPKNREGGSVLIPSSSSAQHRRHTHSRTHLKRSCLFGFSLFLLLTHAIFL